MTRWITIVLTWIAAAVLVAAAHARLDAASTAGSAAAVVAVIVLAAFLYMRLCARDASTSHALAVGIAWLAMSVAAEMIATRVLGHGWFALLGTPARPLLRNFFPFVWIFSPVLFARSAEAPAQ